MPNATAAVMDITKLSVCARYQQNQRILKSVSFKLHPGKVYALVGESGSGKSVTSLDIMHLLPDALKITSGSVHFDGHDLFTATEQEMTTYIQQIKITNR